MPDLVRGPGLLAGVRRWNVPADEGFASMRCARTKSTRSRIRELIFSLSLQQFYGSVNKSPLPGGSTLDSDFALTEAGQSALN